MTNIKKNPKTLRKPEIESLPTVGAEKSRLALMPSLNAAVVISTYQSDLMGKNMDMDAMLEHLSGTFAGVKGGDLHHLEAMLIGQASALQSIFTNLAMRANSQNHVPHYQTFLGLALKAQAQSRATISALVDLKYPRQATFVKQANIANGPQQVNNGIQPTDKAAHARKSATSQNKLLEQPHEPDQTHRLDTRKASPSVRADSAMATVEEVDRAQKRTR